MTRHATKTPGRKCAMKGCRVSTCVRARRAYDREYQRARRARMRATTLPS